MGTQQNKPRPIVIFGDASGNSMAPQKKHEHHETQPDKISLYEYVKLAQKKLDNNIQYITVN